MNASKRWDVFISHASEDKNSIARPLAKLLEKAGLTVWFDEWALTVGDQLLQKIEDGLAQSRFGIVILSKAYLSKSWPENEIGGLFARQVDGRKVILPVWHEIDAAYLRETRPMLANLLAVRTDQGLEKVAAELLRAMGQDSPYSPEPRASIGSRIRAWCVRRKWRIAAASVLALVLIWPQICPNDFWRADAIPQDAQSTPADLGTANSYFKRTADGFIVFAKGSHLHDFAFQMTLPFQPGSISWTVRSQLDRDEGYRFLLDQDVQSVHITGEWGPKGERREWDSVGDSQFAVKPEDAIQKLNITTLVKGHVLHTSVEVVSTAERWLTNPCPITLAITDTNLRIDTNLFQWHKPSYPSGGLAFRVLKGPPPESWKIFPLPPGTQCGDPL